MRSLFAIFLLAFLMACALVLASDIKPAIVPAAVPTANKQGNSSHFLLWSGAATPGNCIQLDGSGNASDSGNPCGTGSGGTGSGITVYSSPALTLAAGTYYFPIGGGSLNSATESVAQTAVTALTLGNFYVQLSTPLGALASAVFTWNKGGSAQTLTCTISGASQTACNDTTHSFTTTAGDLLDIQAVVTGTPAPFAIIMTATTGATGGPDGPTNAVQINAGGGAFGGNVAFEWDPVTGAVTLGFPEPQINISGTTYPFGLVSHSNSQIIGLSVGTHSDTGAIPAMDFHFSRGVEGAETAVQNGDFLGDHVWLGYDGTAYQPAAQLIGLVCDAVSSGIVPGCLFIQTADATGNPNSAIEIDDKQNVTIPAALTAGIGAAMDNSAAGSSVPTRTGTGAPTGQNCLKVGDQYFQTDATAGQNVWLATTFGTPCTWTQMAGGGGGGSTTTVGPLASLPGSVPASGNQYICTDSVYTFVSNGSAWLPFVHGFQVVQPILSAFTQVHVDRSTFDTTHGGILQLISNAGNTTDAQVLAQNIPSSGAYYVDAAFELLVMSGQPNGGAGSGLSGGTATSDAIAYNNIGVESGLVSHCQQQLLNSTSSFNGNNGASVCTMVGPLIWTRVFDDGTTNRTFYVSTNGYQWSQMYQESRTTLFLPNQAVLAASPVNAQIAIHWVHFSIHT